MKFHASEHDHRYEQAVNEHEDREARKHSISDSWITDAPEPDSLNLDTVDSTTADPKPLELSCTESACEWFDELERRNPEGEV